MSASPPHVEAVLLGAGAGRRFGGPKAALHLAGRWMLPRIVSALRQGGAKRVILVLSEQARDALGGLGDPGADLTVLNPLPEAGRTGSVQCALPHLDPAAHGVLVHPCDVPLLSGASVASLVQAWSRAPGCEDLAARPVTPSRRGGHPLLLGSARLAELRDMAPDRSLRELLHRDRSRRLDVVLSGDPGPFLDVDTPEQAALLERLLAPATPPPADPGGQSGTS